MKIVYNIYHKLADIRIVKWFAKMYRGGFFVSNFIAGRKLKHIVELQKKEKKEKICVVFLRQYAAAWCKVETVYKKMLEDPKFEVFILSLYDDVCNFKEEDTFKFLSGLGYNNIIRVKNKNDIFDIKKLNPQYVFYQRPYDRYLPKQYRSNEVSKYAKIFYIPYAYLLTKTSKDICMTKLFYRNLYFILKKMSCVLNKILIDLNIHTRKDIERLLI